MPTPQALRARWKRERRESRPARPADVQPRRFAIGTHRTGRLVAETTPAQALELASIPHASFVIGANDQIDDVNALAEALTGQARGQLVGQRMDGVISALGPSRRASRVRFVSGARVHHASGREIPISVMLCPHDKGSVIAFVSAPDEPCSRELNVAQIVHDLKNPLSTISLEMCLLEDTLRQRGEVGLCSAVRRVTHNVEFLDRLVHDLLDTCAIEAGQFAVERAPVELRAVLERVIDRVIATRDRGRVVLEAPRAMTVSLDPLRIERVVANLLQNALAYAPKASGIIVRLDMICGHARVSVIDAGPGMTPAEAMCVFEKYRRLGNARGPDGSGLGLYVCKQIIDAHNGRIGVESVFGVGSQFFFELPMP